MVPPAFGKLSVRSTSKRIDAIRFPRIDISGFEKLNVRWTS